MKYDSWTSARDSQVNKDYNYGTLTLSHHPNKKKRKKRSPNASLTIFP